MVLKNFTPPTFVYNLNKRFRSTIFNFNKVIFVFNIEGILFLILIISHVIVVTHLLTEDNKKTDITSFIDSFVKDTNIGTQ